MVSVNLKRHYFRIEEHISKITTFSLMVLILLASILPASAVINTTTVEIRGTMWNDTSNATAANSWGPQDFPGFVYDINDNIGTEALIILQMNLAGSDNSGGYWYEQRTIAKSNLIYSTDAQAMGLKVALALGLYGNNLGLTAKGLEQATTGKAFDGGKYFIVGWQGEKYVAVNGKVDKLSRLILEQGNSVGDVKNLTVGETWNIGEGWELTLNSIDTGASPAQARLVLKKDGILKDEHIISSGAAGDKPIYTYVENSISGENDVPMFVTYASNISSNIIQLRYTWAISENVTQISSGTSYGVFKDAEVTNLSKSLKLKNSDTTITLSKGSTIPLIGNITFRVADSNVLRFYPMVIRDQPGTYELHGTMWSDTSYTTVANSWNPINFAGFFYDIKYNLGTENLNILQTNLAGSINSLGWAEQRTIDKSELLYSTAAQPKALNVVSIGLGMNPTYWDAIVALNKGLEQTGSGKAFDGGNYYIVGWQGEKYVALNSKVDKLSKLVFEQGTTAADKKTLTIGETWYIGDGWELKVNSIDSNASTRQVRFTLSKDGVAKDDKIVTLGGLNDKPIYTYVESSLGGEIDVPVFVTYVDSIFTDIVQLRYTWVISENVTQISSGTSYGVFKDAEVTNNSKDLKLKNSDTAISLSRNSIIDLMDNLKFKVADSDTLRFYPFVTYEIFPLPPPPPPPKPFDTLKFEPYVWNLVSVPKTLVDPAVNTAFVNLSLDPTNIKWLFNGSAWNHPSNIIPLSGYWVFNNASTPIFQKLNYRDMSGPNVPPSMTLKSGWNLIGHTSTQSMPVESALISIKGKYSHLLTYSPSEGWKMYIVGNPYLQQFSAFESGKGYWIFMTEDATYAAVDI